MSTSEKVLYLVAGTGVGAIMGLLFAPRAGSELRSDLAGQAQRGVDVLSEKMEEGRKYVQEKGGTASTSVRNIVERGRQTLNDSVEGVKTRFNESVEAGKQEYQGHRNG